MGNQWTLQDARTKFSAVVDAAVAGEPQHVTRRGIDAVVVLSVEEYRRLVGEGEAGEATRCYGKRTASKALESGEDLS